MREYTKANAISLLYFLRGESALGEVDCFWTLPIPTTTLMAQEGEVWAIPKDFVLEYMSKVINKILARKVFNLSNKIQILNKTSLREKILSYLQAYPHTALKHYELADFLGVSRPAISKEILAMIKERILIEQGHHLKIVI